MKNDQIKISLAALSNRAKELLNTVHPPSNTLNQTVLLAYYKKSLTNLVVLLKEDKHEELIKKLKTFLSANWTLINKTPLSYTALPEDELTLLLCDVAQYIKEHSNEEECILKLLMPTISIEANKDGVALLEKLDIKQVLKTYILGQGGYYLIPASQLTDLYNTPPKEWFNGYYDYQNHSEEMARINQEEYERLNRHSPETMALCNAYKQHELCIKQNDSLLSHLQQFTRSLYFNSVKGVGKEENAGSGTYDAIIKFNEYYSKLDKQTKDRIPEAVKEEIEFLLNLSSNKEVNINATENLSTCIATRRDALIKAMTAQENDLAAIGLTSESKAALIAEKKQQITECQTALSTSLKQNKYCGHDLLGLTRTLINSLGINYTFSSMVDVHELAKLSVSELTDVCQDESIQKQIVRQFVDLETLIFFIHETSVDQLTVILTLCGRALANKLIKSGKHITALLITLDKEHAELICSLFKEVILAKTYRDWQALAGGLGLTYLSQEQRSALYIAIKEEIPTYIGHARAFSGLMYHFSREECNEMYSMMKEEIPAFINEPYDIMKMLLRLGPEQCIAFCHSIKEKIPTIIKDAYSFWGAVNLLSLEKRSLIYTIMREEIPSLIKSSVDFSRVLKELSPEQCSAIYAVMKDKIPTFIRCAYDFTRVLNYLSPEQCNEVCNAIQKQIPEFIRSRSDFSLALKDLSPEGCSALCSVIKDRIPVFIRNVADLKSVLKDLSPQQRSVVCSAIKEEIPAVIKSTVDFASLLKALTPEQRSIVFGAMKKHIPALMKNEGSFKRVLEHLSPKECRAICWMMKDKIPALINNAYNLNRVLNPLSPEQRTAVCHVMQEQIPTFIKSAKDLNSVFQYLTPKLRIALYITIKEKNITYINSANDLNLELQYLSPEQRNTVYMITKERIPAFIKDDYNLNLVLEYLSSEQRSAVCSAMKEQILTFFRNGPLFKLSLFSPKQRTTLCVSLEYLHKLTPTPPLAKALFSLFEGEEKKKIQQHFFYCLVQEIKTKSKELNDSGFVLAHHAAERLVNDLDQASVAYFGNANTTPSMDYTQFTSACETAINNADELNNHRSWVEFFAQLILGIVSLGIIPIALSVASKIATDSWRYRLFDTNSGKKMQEIHAFVSDPICCTS